MATSDLGPFVWVFLPGQAEPVLAGALAPSGRGAGMAFRYSNRYLDRGDAVSIGPDLPLGPTTFSPAAGHGMPSSIRDAMPDNWGRQVINRELGLDLDDQLPDVRYMLESGSDRVGAIDFQARPDEYVPRLGGGTLAGAADAALTIDADQAGPELDRAVRNTLSAAGGSQPKAYVTYDGRQWLAKFTTPYDKTSPLTKAERAALHIARKAGIDVPDSLLVEVEGRGTVLLMERFDRHGASRRMVLSGMTLAEEHRPAGGSYPRLVERVRSLSDQPETVGRELFRRLAFRIGMRIDDDHLRNVAFFWDGAHASFAPAFDLSPELAGANPVGLTDLGDGSTEFTLRALFDRHHHYHVTRDEAEGIVESTVDTIREHREEAADVARMARHEREMLIRRTVTPELLGETRSPKHHIGWAGEGKRVPPKAGMVWVEAHVRRGRVVDGHWRAAPRRH